jgi:hypothetical protein
VEPGDSRVLKLETLARSPAAGVTHTATATAEPDLSASASATIEIVGVPASNLQVKADVNPVEINKEITYSLKVMNRGSLAMKNVRLSAKLSPELVAVGVMGLTEAKFDTKANTIAFAPVIAIERGQELNFTIKVRAVKAGDARCRVEMSSDGSPQPEADEVATTVIDPANLQSAPPPVGGAKDVQPPPKEKGKEGDNIPPPPPPNMESPPAVAAPPANPPTAVPPPPQGKPLPKG